MKKLITLLAAHIVAVFLLSAQNAVFNWADPLSLTPPFNAPDANNSYGEYISNVTFTSDLVKFTVHDDNVKEQSQRARFLYGYLTQTVEMRAYPTSTLDFSLDVATEDASGILRIEFEGAKVGEDYFEYLGDEGSLEGSVWTASRGSVHAVSFYVNTTINCTSIKVSYDIAAVDDITIDQAADADCQWYTIAGQRLSAAPSVPGVYVRRSAGCVSKVAVR